MNKVPEHVAIIVDAGPTADGARDGQLLDDRMAAARAMFAAASESGVRHLTLCVETPGRTLDGTAATRLFGALRRELEAAERRGLSVRIPNISGRADLVAATRKLAEQVRSGSLDPDAVSLELLHKQLSGGATPDPDLIILCGRADLVAGQSIDARPHRLSGCLLFDAAYAEFHFCEQPFAQLTAADWQRALSDYSQRDRRFGRTSEPLDQADPLPPPTTRFTAAPARTASLP